MAKSVQPPMVFCSALSGHIYVTTRYRTLGNGVFVAERKYDVTAEAELAMTQRKAILRRYKRRAMKKRRT